MEKYYKQFEVALKNQHDNIKTMAIIYCNALKEDSRSRAKFKAKFNLPYTALDRLERIGKEVDIPEMFYVPALWNWKILATMPKQMQKRLILESTELVLDNGDIGMVFFTEIKRWDALTIYDEQSKTIRSIEQQRIFKGRFDKKIVESQDMASKIRASMVRNLTQEDLEHLPTKKLLTSLKNRKIDLKPKQLAEISNNPEDLFKAYQLAMSEE